MTFRWLDHIAGKLDRGYGGSRGWYSTAMLGVIALFDKFSKDTVLTWSPAFNAAVAHDFFAKLEVLLKKPVAGPRSESELETAFVQLTMDCYDFHKLHQKYSRWVIDFNTEAAAWAAQCQSDRTIAEEMPTFVGVGSVSTAGGSSSTGLEPPLKKARAKAGAKAAATKKVTPLAAVQPIVAPVVLQQGGGVLTRGKSGLRPASDNCRYHVKMLFLNLNACGVTNCQFYHQPDVKHFTKSEMNSWVSKVCANDSDVAALRKAIASQAR